MQNVVEELAQYLCRDEEFDPVTDAVPEPTGAKVTEVIEEEEEGEPEEEEELVSKYPVIDAQELVEDLEDGLQHISEVD